MALTAPAQAKARFRLAWRSLACPVHLSWRTIPFRFPLHVKANGCSSLVLALCLSLPLLAQEFAYQREIHPNGTGPQRLEVDLELLARCQPGLKDLRLKDGQNREIPFVLVPPAPGKAIWIKGALQPIPETKHKSGFELDLGKAHPIGKLRLEGLQAPFLKRFSLEGSGDRNRWTELIREGSVFDLPEEGLQLLTVAFKRGEYRYLRLVWDDRSSARQRMPGSAWVQPDSPGSTPPRAASGWTQRPIKDNCSQFAIPLPGPNLPLRALTLEIANNGPLMRKAWISENTGTGKRELGSAILKRVERQGVSASNLRIPLYSALSSEILLSVDNGNNPPLDLRQIWVEYDPLPWIYFEPTGHFPLKAFFGNKSLLEPRYDLAALRDRLTPGNLPAATWQPVQLEHAGTAPAHAFQAPPPGPALPKSAFAHQRPIPDSPPGLCALVLDAHVLSRSPHLFDLRILDQEGRQIPYILERRTEPLEQTLPIPPATLSEKTSTYRIQLPQPRLRQARLLLESDPGLFRRQVSLEEERPEGTPRFLGESLWVQQEANPWPDNTLGQPLLFETGNLQGRSLLLKVMEGDNPSLPIRKIRLQLPCWRLRFFHPGGNLHLWYGNPTLEEAQYDFALKTSILQEMPAKELQLVEIKAKPESVSSKVWLFWGALLAALVGLSAVLVKLLKGPAQSQ